MRNFQIMRRNVVGPLIVQIYKGRSGFGGGVHCVFVPFSSGACVQQVERARWRSSRQRQKGQTRSEHHHETHPEPRRCEQTRSR